MGENARVPREVFIYAAPVHAERQPEQQLLDGDTEYEPTMQRGEIPDGRDVPRREPAQPEHERAVENKEEHAPDQGVPREIGPAPAL